MHMCLVLLSKVPLDPVSCVIDGPTSSGSYLTGPKGPAVLGTSHQILPPWGLELCSASQGRNSIEPLRRGLDIGRG